MIRTVIVSALLSVIASVGAGVALLGQKNAEPGILRAHKVEILDENNVARLVLEASPDCSCLRVLSPAGTNTVELGEKMDRNAGLSSGTPRLVLRNKEGADLSLLTLDVYGNGVLVFNSQNKEGKVMLGHLATGDTIPPGDRGAWGLQVLGTDHLSTGLGFMDSGKLIRPMLSEAGQTRNSTH